jgi:hypothetical protein
MDKHLELDSLGILRQTKLPPSFAWLQDSDKALLVELLLAGDGGLTRAFVAKWDKASAECSMRLSARSLVDWGTDKRGKPSFLTLTWKGEDLAKLVMQVARNATRSTRPGSPFSAARSLPQA